MRKYIEICLTSSMQAALERYMVEKKVSMLDAAAALILIEFLYKEGYF
jgi:hypothetical protein